MPEQALYLKWRPSAFDDVVGQEHVVRTLRNSLKTGRIRHAYLFCGPRGTGKTTMARLLAKAVNCHHSDPEQRPCNQCPACAAVNEGRYLDLIEIDAATHTGVDDVRDLRDKIAFAPSEGRYKIYIIDEVHRFSGSAFDALLKTLEEPPDHAIFVLATTEIDKVPATIKSRSLQFEFRRLSLQEVTDRLQEIAESEGLRIERGALELIARQGTGSARDSISLLDQVVSDPAEVITVEVAQRILGTASITAVRDLARAVVEGDVAAGLRVINGAVDTGSDPRQFGQQVVEYLRAILLAQTATADLIAASNEERKVYSDLAARVERTTLLRAIRAFNEAVNNYRGGWQPQLALELALVESVRGGSTEAAAPIAVGAARPPADIEALVRRLLAEQSGTPAPAQPVPEPEVSVPPGTPPVIEVLLIRERWNDMLKVLFQINKTAPEVVQHLRPLRVDGNIVTLGTDNQIYFGRFQPSDRHGAGRIKAIEKALHEIHALELRIKVLLVKDLNSELTLHTPSPDLLSDPLVATGLELGGQIKSSD